jgi:hypothetical protein
MIGYHDLCHGLEMLLIDQAEGKKRRRRWRAALRSFRGEQ